MSNCGICNKEEKDDMVPCSGVCYQQYHLDCAKVTKTVYTNLMKTPQLRYYCLPCSKVNTIEVVKRIDTLTVTMTSLVAQFTELAALMTKSLTAPASIPASQDSSIIPRTRNQPSNIIEIEGTGLWSTGLKAAAPPPKSFVFIGKLDPKTTKEEMISHIAANGDFNASDIDCFPLVSKLADVSRLRYISFKVGVIPSKANELMNPEIWPKGVIVHEFIQYPRSRISAPPARLPHSKKD